MSNTNTTNNIMKVEDFTPVKPKRKYTKKPKVEAPASPISTSTGENNDENSYNLIVNYKKIMWNVFNRLIPAPNVDILYPHIQNLSPMQMLCFLPFCSDDSNPSPTLPTQSFSPNLSIPHRTSQFLRDGPRLSIQLWERYNLQPVPYSPFKLN